VKLLVGGVLLLSRAASAADACALVPAGQLSTYLGIAKQTPFKVPELPQKATEAKACSYAGQEYNATVILIRFDSPAAARGYLSKIREEGEKDGHREVRRRGWVFLARQHARRQKEWRAENKCEPSQY
jgi:hypothetical protein